jgi:hypothetical protein
LFVFLVIIRNKKKEIIVITKSTRMRWAGHVAHMGRRLMHIRFWWEI